MVVMGSLQAGIPTPSAIPLNSHKIIIDLKDCFFSIPLHPQDQHRFAFTVPAPRLQGPSSRYQWTVLPQGMANSPTLCQQFVGQAIQPLRQTWPSVHVFHYMDDILLACIDENTLYRCYAHLQTLLRDSGLHLAPNKIQLTDPYTYLGFQLTHSTIHGPKPQLRLDTLHSLHDFQKLLGDINWLLPSLAIPKSTLRPLYDILRGDPSPTSPRSLTPLARTALQHVQEAINTQSLTYIDYTQPLTLIVLPSPIQPTALFWQNAPLLWIHLSVSPKKVLNPYYDLIAQIIMTGRKQAKIYYHKEPDVIILPYSEHQLTWLLQTSDTWAIALAAFPGQTQHHYPPNKLLAFFSRHPHIFPKITSYTPIANATTIFTDGSSSGHAAYTCLDHNPIIIPTPGLSAQHAELQAIIQVFQDFPNTPINIYTDSHYLATSVPLLETLSNFFHYTSVVPLFATLQTLIHARTHSFFIGHIRAHSGLPGPLASGNALADQAARSTSAFPMLLPTPRTRPSLSNVSQAQAAHDLHHLNAQSLRTLFKITREQARAIVKQCPKCITHLPSPNLGVNPKGLIPNALWQMDITHILSFRQLRFVHVSVDTFSGYIFASLQSGETTKHVIAHMLAAMAHMGCPTRLKTDNGPGYTSKSFAEFCQHLNIIHSTGIPYNPQGQGIVERANQKLKITISKLSTVTWYPTKGSPRNILNHALLIINFLSLDQNNRSAADRFWHPSTASSFATALWKDPLTNQWHGPDPVLIWGRGSACIYSQADHNARWVPERLVKQLNKPAQGGAPEG